MNIDNRFLVLILIIVSFGTIAFGQKEELGYFDYDQFIKLTPHDSIYSIQLKDKETADKRYNEYKLYEQQGLIKSVSHWSDIELCIHSDTIIKHDEDFFSFYYTDPEGNLVILRQGIVVSLKNSNNIDDLIQKYSDINLKVKDFLLNELYFLSCNINNSEDILRLIKKLYDDVSINFNFCEPDMYNEFRIIND